jgi:hypothetical protein
VNQSRENNQQTKTDFKNNHQIMWAIYHHAKPDSCSKDRVPRLRLSLVELTIPDKTFLTEKPKLSILNPNVDLDGFCAEKSQTFYCNQTCDYKGNGSYCSVLARLIEQMNLEERSPGTPAHDLVTFRCTRMTSIDPTTIETPTILITNYLEPKKLEL